MARLEKTTAGKADIKGIVVDEPEDKGNNTSFVLRIDRAHSDIVVSAPAYAPIGYGDEVEVRGVLGRPRPIVDELTGREFDYPDHLAAKNIFYTMKASSAEVLSRGHGGLIRRTLIAAKEKFERSVSEALPEPHALLANGLVVAGKGALGKELQDEFKRAGLIHIVVLSGFNVAIIARAILALFSFLPGKLSAVGGGLGIIAFAIMTGGDAPVVRSSIMSIIALFAHSTGRKYEAMRGLIIAALIVTILNPRVPIYDSSFQLSFASTLGLILLGTPISGYLKWLPEKWEIRGLIAATLSTQIFVTPLLMKLSGNVSMVALGANLLVLPLIPFTMLIVCFVAGFSFIGTIALDFARMLLPGFIAFQSGALLALPWSFLAYLLLSYELQVVHFFASLPFAAVSFFTPTWAGLGVWYVFYGTVLWRYYRHRKRKAPAARPGQMINQADGSG